MQYLLHLYTVFVVATILVKAMTSKDFLASWNKNVVDR
jgi:hypothetical protein